jgi:hypothetical protein
MPNELENETLILVFEKPSLSARTKLGTPEHKVFERLATASLSSSETGLFMRILHRCIISNIRWRQISFQTGLTDKHLK